MYCDYAQGPGEKAPQAPAPAAAAASATQPARYVVTCCSIIQSVCLDWNLTSISLLLAGHPRKPRNEICSNGRINYFIWSVFLVLLRSSCFDKSNFWFHVIWVMQPCGLYLECRRLKTIVLKLVVCLSEAGYFFHCLFLSGIWLIL